MSGATALPLPLGTPDELTAVSNTLVRVADRVAQTLIYQHGGSSPVIAASWQGSAAQSRAEEATTLKSRLTAANGRLPEIGTALTTYGGVLETTIADVERWQEQWDEAEETYRTHIRQLNNEPDEEGFDKQAVADGYADQRDAEHQRLLRLYETAMEDLRTAGTTAAGTIRGQCDLVVPSANAGDRLEVGAYLLADLPMSGGEAMTELAAQLAPELADELRDASTGGDPEALAAILEKYGEYADDPYFAHAVMAELEAEGLMDAFTGLAIANMRNGHDDDLRDAQQEVMTMLGTMYATASGPAEGDIDPHGYNREGIEQWREEVWFPALTESGRAVHDLADEGFAAGTYDGYWAQGLLLSAGTAAGVTPGTDYMRHVGEDMVAWDRAYGQYDGERDWDFAAPFNRPNLIGYEDDSPRATFSDDPIHALLEAASADEESTYALLMSRVPGEDGRQPIVEYLVRERGGTMAYDQPFMDQGQLLAETVAEHGRDRTDLQSTALAGHYLNAYVETVGSGTFANGEEISEYAFASGRTGTADVISAHIEDFVRATDQADRTDDPYSEVIGAEGDPRSWRVNFDQDAVHNFAQVFGDLALDRPDEVVTAENPGAVDNPPALQRVFNAAVAHNALSLNQAFADPDGDPVVAMDRGAGFLVHLTESAGHGRIESAEAQDAYNEYLTKVLDAGVGLVPVGDIPVVGSISDAAYGLATDELLDRLIDTSHADRQHTTEAGVGQTVRALLQEQGTMALVEAGAWEEGKDPVTWAAAHPLSPSQTFVRDGELMPIEEILASPERTAAFFDQYLREQDGGAGAIRELTDQIEEATGAGSVIADDDYEAGGG
jgi:hypothetical protein